MGPPVEFDARSSSVNLPATKQPDIWYKAPSDEDHLLWERVETDSGYGRD